MRSTTGITGVNRDDQGSEANAGLRTVTALFVFAGRSGWGRAEFGQASFEVDAPVKVFEQAGYGFGWFNAAV